MGIGLGGADSPRNASMKRSLNPFFKLDLDDVFLVALLRLSPVGVVLRSPVAAESSEDMTDSSGSVALVIVPSSPVREVRTEGSSEAVNSEAVNSEAVNSEAVNSEAVNSEAVNSEAVNSEAVNSEAVNSEAVNSEAVNSEVVRSEAVSSEACSDLLGSLGLLCCVEEERFVLISLGRTFSTGRLCGSRAGAGSASTNGSTVLFSQDSILLGWLATGLGGGSTLSVMIFLPWVRACFKTLVASLKLGFLFVLGRFEELPRAGRSSSLNAEYPTGISASFDGRLGGLSDSSSDSSDPLVQESSSETSSVKYVLVSV